MRRAIVLRRDETDPGDIDKCTEQQELEVVFTVTIETEHPRLAVLIAIEHILNHRAEVVVIPYLTTEAVWAAREWLAQAELVDVVIAGGILPLAGCGGEIATIAPAAADTVPTPCHPPSPIAGPELAVFTESQIVAMPEGCPVPSYNTATLSRSATRGRHGQVKDDIDKAAQDDPEWVVWSSPQQTAEAIDRLFIKSLPTVPADWKKHSGSAIGPMPQGVDRYSREMTDWVEDAFNYLLPDDDALTERDNAVLVNGFVCYIGEYFVRYCDGRWVNDPELKVLYEFGLSICYDWTDSADYPEDLLFSSANQGDFTVAAFQWYSRTVDHAYAHGLPHAQLELEKKLGVGRWSSGRTSSDTASGWHQETDEGAEEPDIVADNQLSLDLGLGMEEKMEESGIVGDNQLSMDLGVSVEQTEWGKWVDPDRRAAQVQKFLNYAGLQRMPSKLWPEDSSDLHHLNDVCRELFPDSDTPYRAENQDMTDAFICFLGACFEKYVEGKWVDHTEHGHDKSFYDGGVNPALHWVDYDGDEDECTVFDYIDSMVEHNLEHGDGFVHITADLRRKYYSLM
ncbi:hypothetical protein ACFWPH_14015 [Nocardia sp. NPDC058499]|uniref:hypothetical protein n=1 Tax=Nocardia sp. NPDC058499 TaxID=3346530 RepID=UPI00364F3507